MKVEIHASKISGSVRIPSSKSDAHRALICAALATKQKSIISDVDFNEDIYATISALKNFGAEIKINDNKVEVFGVSLEKKNELEFDANESGSTLRFLIPLFSHFSSKTIVKGSSRLLERPLDVYEKIMGTNLIKFSDYIKVNHTFENGIYEINGNVSSQFISGLLFLLPLLNKDSLIKIIPPFESSSYVKMTIATLAKFGVSVILKDNEILIKGNQSYKACNYNVEGDYSQASFFVVLGTLNNKVKCLGLNHNSLQGDKTIIDIIRQMNGNIESLEEGILVNKSNLNGITIDLANCPDLGPILMVAASLSKGETRIINAYRLRLKESDRIASMEQELKKFGVSIVSSQNEVIINGTSDLYAPKQVIEAHNDHRIAMSLAILMLCLNEGSMVLDGAQCINKSYPNFYNDLRSLNAKVVELND